MPGGQPLQRRALMAWAAATLTPAVAAQPDAGRAIDAQVQAALRERRVPGAAVAVVERGRVLRARGYGWANLEHRVPVTPHTVFQSGSLAKQFTAVAVLLLAEDGRLALDDPLARHLPQTPPAWQAITVRQLLNHTAGLADYGEHTLDLRRDYSEAELAQRIFSLPLEAPAGARWRYGDTGYVLLGILIGQLSGRFYGDVLRERVFAPLGMRGARVISEAELVPHRAAGYRLEGGAIRNQEWVAPTLNTTADGSLYLSLQDWLVWETTLRRRALLRAASWQEVFTPARLNDGSTYPYGLGWELPSAPDPLAGYRHEGAWQGFKSAYLHATAADLTVIVLCNLAQAEPMQLAVQVAVQLAHARLQVPQ